MTNANETTLTGSPKQIDWARKIIASYASQIEVEVALLTGPTATNYSHPAEKLARCAAALDSIRHDEWEARYWIDSRACDWRRIVVDLTSDLDPQASHLGYDVTGDASRCQICGMPTVHPVSGRQHSHESR